MHSANVMDKNVGAFSQTSNNAIQQMSANIMLECLAMHTTLLSIAIMSGYPLPPLGPPSLGLEMRHSFQGVVNIALKHQ